MTTRHKYQRRLIPVVTGLAVKPDGRFLLTQRHQPRYPLWHLKWNIPGGAMEWGETPEQALEREFAEELGVKPAIIYPHPIPATSLWYGQDTGYPTDSHILLLCYAVDIGEQVLDLTLDPEKETCAAEWFTVTDALKLDTLPHTQETIQQVLAALR